MSRGSAFSEGGWHMEENGEGERKKKKEMVSELGELEFA